MVFPPPLKTVEGVAIVAIGLWVHVQQMSIFGAESTKPAPNVAAGVFVCSVLIVLTNLRPTWPDNLRLPFQLLRLPTELAVILFSVELMYKTFWYMALQLFRLAIMWLCTFSTNEQSGRFDKWLQSDVFVSLQIGLAFACLTFALFTCLRKQDMTTIGNGQTTDSEISESDQTSVTT